MNPDMKNIFTAIRQIVAKEWNSFRGASSAPDRKEKKTIEQLIDIINEKIKLGKTILSPESLKIALSYHEISKETLSFEDILVLVKQNYNLSSEMRICILKNSTDDGNVVFDIVACSEKNEILFSQDCPWCHVIIASPELELLAMFKSESMLVLK